MSTGLVDRQVEAYNAHDLEAFLACYSPDVTIRDGHGQLLMSGIEALRREYGEWFAVHPEVHGDVTNRLVAGAWVVDEETITTSAGVMKAVVAYHVSESLIDAVVLLLGEEA